MLFFPEEPHVNSVNFFFKNILNNIDLACVDQCEELCIDVNFK